MPPSYQVAQRQLFQYPQEKPSSRSSYPTFLSFQDSALLQLKWAWRGLHDAFRWNVVFSVVAKCVCSLQIQIAVPLTALQ
jgi:etoposide-induced 2.4 mRNA